MADWVERGNALALRLRYLRLYQHLVEAILESQKLPDQISYRDLHWEAAGQLASGSQCQEWQNFSWMVDLVAQFRFLLGYSPGVVDVRSTVLFATLIRKPYPEQYRTREELITEAEEQFRAVYGPSAGRRLTLDDVTNLVERHGHLLLQRDGKIAAQCAVVSGRVGVILRSQPGVLMTCLAHVYRECYGERLSFVHPEPKFSRFTVADTASWATAEVGGIQEDEEPTEFIHILCGILTQFGFFLVIGRTCPVFATEKQLMVFGREAVVDSLNRSDPSVWSRQQTFLVEKEFAMLTDPVGLSGVLKRLVLANVPKIPQRVFLEHPTVLIGSSRSGYCERTAVGLSQFFAIEPKRFDELFDNTSLYVVFQGPTEKRVMTKVAAVYITRYIYARARTVLEAEGGRMAWSDFVKAYTKKHRDGLIEHNILELCQGPERLTFSEIGGVKFIELPSAKSEGPQKEKGPLQLPPKPDDVPADHRQRGKELEANLRTLLEEGGGKLDMALVPEQYLKRFGAQPQFGGKMKVFFREMSGVRIEKVTVRGKKLSLVVLEKHATERPEATEPTAAPVTDWPDGFDHAAQSDHLRQMLTLYADGVSLKRVRDSFKKMFNERLVLPARLDTLKEFLDSLDFAEVVSTKAGACVRLKTFEPSRCERQDFIQRVVGILQKATTHEKREIGYGTLCEVYHDDFSEPIPSSRQFEKNNIYEMFRRSTQIVVRLNEQRDEVLLSLKTGRPVKEIPVSVDVVQALVAFVKVRGQGVPYEELHREFRQKSAEDTGLAFAEVLSHTQKLVLYRDGDEEKIRLRGMQVRPSDQALAPLINMLAALSPISARALTKQANLDVTSFGFGQATDFFASLNDTFICNRQLVKLRGFPLPKSLADSIRKVFSELRTEMLCRDFGELFRNRTGVAVNPTCLGFANWARLLDISFPNELIVNASGYMRLRKQQPKRKVWPPPASASSFSDGKSSANEGTSLHNVQTLLHELGCVLFPEELVEEYKARFHQDLDQKILPGLLLKIASKLTVRILTDGNGRASIQLPGEIDDATEKFYSMDYDLAHSVSSGHDGGMRRPGAREQVRRVLRQNYGFSQCLDVVSAKKHRRNINLVAKYIDDLRNSSGQP